MTQACCASFGGPNQTAETVGICLKKISKQSKKWLKVDFPRKVGSNSMILHDFAAISRGGSFFNDLLQLLVEASLGGPFRKVKTLLEVASMPAETG